MHHSTRRLLRMGTTGILVWTVLIAVPPLARADTLPGGAIRALQQSQASRQSASVKADMVTACQTQSQAPSATIDALRTRLQAARDTKNPTQMRAVLDEVLQQLTAMQESMHGGMGAPREGHHGMQHGS
jgi:cytoskeletal protein RodZ